MTEAERDLLVYLAEGFANLPPDMPITIAQPELNALKAAVRRVKAEHNAKFEPEANPNMSPLMKYDMSVYALVPRKITKAMLIAWVSSDGDLQENWHALLEAGELKHA